MRRPALVQFLVTFLFCSCLLLSARASALEVPILVQELVPQGVPGRQRSAQVVTVGVPLSSTDDIRDAEMLGLSGASAAQFRVLRRDNVTQRARWVLATFLADSPSGNYALTRGSGAFGGTLLASDQGARIVVSTGAATFEIRKSGFNVLDRVLRDGRELVASHQGGGLVLLEGTVRYESGRDANSATIIEENGPVRCVVRSQGVLRSTTGARHLGYLVRLQFDKGRATCRAFVTLRNGELASLSAASFDAAWVEIPYQLGSSQQVLFGRDNGSVGGTLGPGEVAYLHQGDNSFQRSPRTGNIVPQLTPDVGLEVSIAGTVRTTPGSMQDIAHGWMRLQDGTSALLAGMRDLATLFPSGFDVRGGVLSVELFSRHNSRGGLVFSWGAHETREMLVEFTSNNADPEPFRYELQYPMLGRCEFERYRTTGAIYGEQRLVTVEEQRQFFQELGHSWSLSDYGEVDLEFMRQYSFSTTGGGNQFDKDLCHLLDYLRTGHAGRFLQARHDVLWKADQAVLHSDDFDYGERQNGVSDVDVFQPESFHGQGAGSRFDDEHPHWVSMPIYYYMTGDERIREAIVDYGEWRRYRAGHPTYGAINGGAISHFRLWSRAFRDVALLYEITGEQRYLEDTRRMAQVLTQTIEVGTSQGRNMQRGYFFFGDENDLERRIHLFFLTEMNPIGVREAIRVLPIDDPWREELRDYLTGLAYFTLREAQVTPTAIGYPYGYYSARPNTEPGTRGDQTGIVLTHGYETTGDQEFVQRARDFAWRVIEYQHPLRGSELSTHLRIYRWLHRSETGAQLVDPTVEQLPDGRYTLRWNAPADVREVIVKYASRAIVENVGFDQLSRTYKYDPGSVVNFWAANNLEGEPRPAGPGEVVYTTPVLPSGTWHFKVKMLLDSSVPTALEIADFGAAVLEDRVRLSWRVPEETQGNMTGVVVQRADTVEGPYVNRTSAPLVVTNSMVFEDMGVGAEHTYWYRLALIALDGTQEITPPLRVDIVAGTRPTRISSVFAAPGGEPVQIHYSLGREAKSVRLEVFNVAGRKIRVLTQGHQEAGQYVATWDRRDRFGMGIAAGVYLVRLRAGAESSIRKLHLLRN